MNTQTAHTATETRMIPLEINHSEIERAREKLRGAANSFNPLLTFLLKQGIEPSIDEFRELICSTPANLFLYMKRKIAAKHPMLSQLPEALQFQGVEIPAIVTNEATEILKGIQQRSGTYSHSLVYSLIFTKNWDWLISSAAEAQLQNLNTIFGTEQQAEALKEAQMILNAILNWNDKYDSTLIQSLPGSIMHIQNHAPSFIKIPILLRDVTINY